MKRMNLYAALALLLMLGTAVSTSAVAQDDRQRSVSVSGEGKVMASPDMATVRFGVVTRAKNAEEARRQNAEASREAMNAARELGIEDRKIRMETLRLQPYHERDPETRERREAGFEATRIVSVEINDLELLPTLVTDVVQRGANRLHGVDYDLQDRSEIRNEALQKAVLMARSKAELIASTLDVSLGPVLNVQEQSFDFVRPQPRFEMRAAGMMLDEAAPEPDAFAAGEIEVQANVQVSFMLQ